MNRLNQVNAQFGPQVAAKEQEKKDSLSVHDNRTGKHFKTNSTLSQARSTNSLSKMVPSTALTSARLRMPMVRSLALTIPLS